MLRNWTSDAAFRIGQFLYFYRLVGVTLFELIDERILLLIFPNTFEYFFIAYELWRLRWDPAKRSARFWLLVAAGIWIFIKLPQEYWIHIAKLDTTELIADSPIIGWLGLAGIVGLLAFLWIYVRPRLPVPTGASRSLLPGFRPRWTKCTSVMLMSCARADSCLASCSRKRSACSA
jgi:hypothetical protein